MSSSFGTRLNAKCEHKLLPNSKQHKRRNKLKYLPQLRMKMVQCMMCSLIDELTMGGYTPDNDGWC